jgi:hypothetical protein
MTCLKTKEWTPLDPGHVEHKFYCSDGATGELARIDEGRLRERQTPPGVPSP